MIEGAIGHDVAALTIHAGELTVRATIEEGRYAAWIPAGSSPTGTPAPAAKAAQSPCSPTTSP